MVDRAAGCRAAETGRSGRTGIAGWRIRSPVSAITGRTAGAGGTTSRARAAWASATTRAAATAKATEATDLPCSCIAAGPARCKVAGKVTPGDVESVRGVDRASKGGPAGATRAAVASTTGSTCVGPTQAVGGPPALATGRTRCCSGHTSRAAASATAAAPAATAVASATTRATVAALAAGRAGGSRVHRGDREQAHIVDVAAPGAASDATGATGAAVAAGAAVQWCPGHSTRSTVLWWAAGCSVAAGAAVTAVPSLAAVAAASSVAAVAAGAPRRPVAVEGHVVDAERAAVVYGPAERPATGSARASETT